MNEKQYYEDLDRRRQESFAETGTFSEDTESDRKAAITEKGYSGVALIAAAAAGYYLGSRSGGGEVREETEEEAYERQIESRTDTVTVVLIIAIIVVICVVGNLMGIKSS